METDVKVEDTTKTDVKVETPAYADDPKYAKAMETQEQMTDLLETHGFESLDDLKTIVEEGTSLKDLFGDKDAKSVLQKAKKLEEYEAAWAIEEESRLRENEDEPETIARLEKKLKQQENKEQSEKARQKEEKQRQELIARFDSIAEKEVKASTLPKEYHPFTMAHLGVKNPALEVDFTKPNQIKTAAKNGVKLVQDFEQAVIKRYKAGKIDIPNVPSQKDTQTPTGKETKATGFAGARKTLKENLVRWKSARS